MKFINILNCLTNAQAGLSHSKFTVMTSYFIQDEEPLASLPLIGYAVTKPDEVRKFKYLMKLT